MRGQKQHDGRKRGINESVFGSHVVFPTYLKNYALEQKSPENLFWRVLLGLQFAFFVSSVALLVQELLLDK